MGGGSCRFCFKVMGNVKSNSVVGGGKNCSGSDKPFPGALPHLPHNYVWITEFSPQEGEYRK